MFPYDGGNVGDFIGDSARTVWGSIRFRQAGELTPLFSDEGEGALSWEYLASTTGAIGWGGESVQLTRMNFNIPGTHENRPGSNSVLIVISY